MTLLARKRFARVATIAEDRLADLSIAYQKRPRWDEPPRLRGLTRAQRCRLAEDTVRSSRLTQVAASDPTASVEAAGLRSKQVNTINSSRRKSVPDNSGASTRIADVDPIVQPRPGDLLLSEAGVPCRSCLFNTDFWGLTICQVAGAPRSCESRVTLTASAEVPARPW